MTGRVNLESELFAAAGRVKQVHLDRICALGVTPATVAWLGSWSVAFGIVNATVDTSGIYQPGDGPAYIVHPVIAYGHLVDLVAWRPMQPEKWWQRTGHGWAIGADDLEGFGEWGAAPKLYATPLDWLVGGGRGSVVLDWSAPEVAAIRSLDSVECSTPALSATLDRTLRAMTRLPTIQTMEARHAA